MSTINISQLYDLCREEINEWLSKQDWCLAYFALSKVLPMFNELLEKGVKWEKGYIYNILKPRLKKDFETYGLPYLESLAEHYVDEHLPFQNELIDEIVNDNIKRIIDEIYEKLNE